MKQKTKFKKTEIGMIPEDWNLIELEELFDILVGGDLKKLTFSKIKSNEYKYPIYSNSLSNKGLYGFSKTYQYGMGCVTITGRGEVGRAECRKEFFNAIVRLLVLKPKCDISCCFVAYFINTKLNFSHIGSAVNQLTAPVISKFRIAIPFFSEQKSIAKILSDFDSKIELLTEQNKVLESIGQTLFKHWFVDFEFPNEEGKPYKSNGGKMKDSKLGKIPEKWRVSTLRNLVKVQNGFAFKSKDFMAVGNHRIIKIKNIYNNIVDIENTQFITEEIISRIDDKFKIQSGDLIIAMTGAEVAKIGLVEKTNRSLWLNQRVGLFKEAKKGGKIFVYLYLLNKSKQNILKNNAYGAAQPNISSFQIEDLMIILPENVLLTKFFKLFYPLFQKIINNLFNIKLLQKTRDLLISKLMRGEIRVGEE